MFNNRHTLFFTRVSNDCEISTQTAHTSAHVWSLTIYTLKDTIPLWKKFSRLVALDGPWTRRLPVEKRRCSKIFYTFRIGRVMVFRHGLKTSENKSTTSLPPVQVKGARDREEVWCVETVTLWLRIIGVPWCVPAKNPELNRFLQVLRE